MSVEKALDALKSKDYRAAKALIEGIKQSDYGVRHFLIKGLSEMALGDWIPCQKTFTAAASRFPNHAPFWLNKGIAEENNGATAAAIDSLERAATFDATPPEAFGSLSNLYRQSGRSADAVAAARTALERGAPRKDALNTLGLALQAQGEFDAAAEMFELAQQEFPNDAAILLNSANVAVDQKNFVHAWSLFDRARAVSDQPLIRFNEATARLLTGNFSTGWPLFESRLKLPLALRYLPDCPPWQGEDLHGKRLLVVAEQGFGDTIQFCRYGALLKGTNLVWLVPGQLETLLSRSLDGVVVRENDAVPSCDYYLPMMSLPLMSGDAPYIGDVPYLQASRPALPLAKSSKKKVGLVWRGSPTHLRDAHRSIPLRLFLPLLSAVDAEFFAVAIDPYLDDIADLPLNRLPTPLENFDDTASYLVQMDAVVSVDTSVAHLAGALGLAALVLLPFSPDWRWGLECQTFWYPTLKLVRQERFGDWSKVINRSTILLNQLLGSNIAERK